MSVKALSIGSAGSAVGMHLITGATNATPIVITLAANSGLKSGDRLAVSGITGNTGANGEWTLAAVSATTFQLLGSVGNGTYGGTPRAALIFDKTPHMEDHSMYLQTQGNLIGSILLESFGSYAEFAAGNNSLLGIVPAPVVSGATGIVTNTTATAASSSTIASSTIALAAINEGAGFEIKPAKYMRCSVSAYTSGTGAGVILA